ncbi:hypothetical protein ACP70R_007824 [Stipagrostis hirtigluma subsp. patula]
MAATAEAATMSAPAVIGVETAAKEDGVMGVAKRPAAAAWSMAEWAWAAGAVATALKECKAKTAGTKPKVVRVRQEYIDRILSRAANPQKPFFGLTDEKLRSMPEDARQIFSHSFALMKADQDRDEEILAQYRAKGYAEVVVDGEEDDDGCANGEEAAGTATATAGEAAVRVGLCKL